MALESGAAPRGRGAKGFVLPIRSAGELVVVAQRHLLLALRRKGVYNAYPPKEIYDCSD
jgi:hypothetical protein